MSAIEEWQSFTVGRGPAGENSDSWTQLVNVKHTTHLISAIRIAEDQMLLAKLIDDGVLRDTRTKVVYFSPKYWPDGSRYGTFEFFFTWDTILAGRKMYWVEAIRTHKTPIFRFMLTSKDVSHLPVVPYNPDVDAGPIRRVGGEWFWTRNDAPEIVIDDDVPLSDATKVEFGKHHDMQCNERAYGACSERAYAGSRRAKQAFMGVLLGRDIHSLDNLLRQNGKLTSDCQNILSDLYFVLMNGIKFGGPVSDPDAVLDLVRAACLIIQAGSRDRVKRVLGLIADKEIAENAILRLVRDHFSDPTIEWDDWI